MPYRGDQKYAEDVVQNIREASIPWNTRYWEEKVKNGEIHEAEIFITEVLDRKDSRTRSTEMKETIRNSVTSLSWTVSSADNNTSVLAGKQKL